MIFPKLFKHSYKETITQLIRFKFTSTRVRVRFAPSPTGSLHIGGLRTALYNFLLAKSLGGKFILRIEDTDQKKSKAEYVQPLEDTLLWLQMPPDESPRVGGDYGPYKQSERIQIYHDHAQKLLENGTAYKCFCSPERLSSVKESKQGYDNACRNLTSSAIAHHEAQGTPSCIRLKIGSKMEMYDDIVYGPRTMQAFQNAGDPVILKQDGYPTYYLASVIDDHLMQISHVLRGENWMFSMPIMQSLYRAFNWDAPIFGHLPQLLTSKRSKLSKREGAMSVDQYKENGYSSGTLLNFSTYSGGGFGLETRESIMTLTEMIELFNPRKLAAHSALLDDDKLAFFSQLELQQQLTDVSERKILVERLRRMVEQQFLKPCLLDDRYIEEILEWGQTRASKLSDFVSEDFAFLWSDRPSSAVDRQNTSINIEVIQKVLESFEAMKFEDYKQETFTDIFKTLENELQIKKKKLLGIIRLAVIGRNVGPPVGEVFTLIGKQSVMRKLKIHLESLHK